MTLLIPSIWDYYIFAVDKFAICLAYTAKIQSDCSTVISAIAYTSEDLDSIPINA